MQIVFKDQTVRSNTVHYSKQFKSQSLEPQVKK